MRQFLQIFLATVLSAALIVAGQLAEPFLLDDSPALATPAPPDEAGVLSAWSLAIDTLGDVKGEIGPAFSVAGRVSREAARSFEDQVLCELFVNQAGRFKAFKDHLDRGYPMPGPLGKQLGLSLRTGRQKLFVEYRF